jgi:hypothetical protein
MASVEAAEASWRRPRGGDQTTPSRRPRTAFPLANVLHGPSGQPFLRLASSSPWQTGASSQLLKPVFSQVGGGGRRPRQHCEAPPRGPLPGGLAPPGQKRAGSAAPPLRLATSVSEEHLLGCSPRQRLKWLRTQQIKDERRQVQAAQRLLRRDTRRRQQESVERYGVADRGKTGGATTTNH